MNPSFQAGESSFSWKFCGGVPTKCGSSLRRLSVKVTYGRASVKMSFQFSPTKIFLMITLPFGAFGSSSRMFVNLGYRLCQSGDL